MIGKPTETEYAPSHVLYLTLVPENDAVAVLEREADSLAKLADRLAPERETYAYAPGKWTVRQVIGHLIDAERAFGYRIFAVSRGEAAPLPGFEENSYVANAPYAETPLAALLAELAAVRAGNLFLLRAIPDPAWRRIGTANGKTVSARALVYVLAGHFRHHANVLRDRYGLASSI
jgi:hypothetical protein